MKNALLLATLCVLSWSVPAGASPQHAENNKHVHHAAKLSRTAAKSPAVKAYIAAAHTMHKGMNIIYTGDADIDFARGMVPHHQGAVDMIDVLLSHGKDETLRELASAMKNAQELEINIMKHWLFTRDNPSLKPTCVCGTTKAYMEAMDRMHKDMNIVYTGNADIDFARGMIPHHQGAIDMANILLSSGTNPVLRDIALDVVRSQEQEIAIMQEWLKQHPNP